MGSESQNVYTRALARAADILGGKDKLRAKLHVPMFSLEEWLDGRSQPPPDVFLKTVDILSTPTSAPATAETLRTRAPLGAPARQKLLASFLVATFRPEQRIDMLGSALDAALEAAHAPMGSVQVKGDDGLRIVAQRGLSQPFLDFFACVTDASCACGSASRMASRIVVSDVATHPIFAGSEAGKVLAAAGVRALQSTPLISVTGNVLGMLSTHYDQPGEPEAAELEAIDRIAGRAAYWLDHPKA